MSFTRYFNQLKFVFNSHPVYNCTLFKPITTESLQRLQKVKRGIFKFIFIFFKLKHNFSSMKKTFGQN